MASSTRPAPRPGRGAVSNPAGRFEKTRAEAVDDGWGSLEEELPKLPTVVQPAPCRTLISRNKSPDLPFELSINPYRGCEHGCIYCYARPSHAYWDLSPGLDFETRLFYKPDAAQLLRKELAAPGYRCSPITIGANTDPYQPIEREYGITRSILEVLVDCRHPFSIITKGTLIERDIDLLARAARDGLVHAFVSITTLDDALKRRLEPRAASPAARLRVIRTLHDAGVPSGVMVAPVIPVLTDAELERILHAAAEAGARTAGYVLLRLPYEIKDLFEEWLAEHEPLKAKHVLSRLSEMRGGRRNDPRWGHRMRGEGEYAELLRKRFTTACAKAGLSPRDGFRYNMDSFRPPRTGPGQLELF
ncbi:MAG: radical SAM protein [Proteobacteria bacterium]|nr:MAG: radical SAM protein [Pseudomonadota bacterium]